MDIYLNKILKTLLIAFAVLFFYQSGGHAAYTADQPIEQIKSTVDQAITILNDDSLKGKDKHRVRQKQLFNLVDQRFNFQLMARLALGDTWTTVDKNERRHFVELFSELLKNTYIRRVESYSGEQIVFTRQIVKNNLALIFSKYEKNNQDFTINYKMQNNNGKWLVYDVVIEGVSVIKQYRRQFAQILQNETMQGLIKRLDKKVKELVQASDDEPVKS